MSSLELNAEHLYVQLREALRPQIKPGAALVGIWSGGAWLAERLQADLGPQVPVGVISSSMHRDDFGERGLSTAGGSTRLPFEVEGAHLLLVDDVLYTGRTIRAVLNELFDFGRPASVTLAVLVDRGGRELPIEATYAAVRVVLPATQRLSLQRDAQGRFAFSVDAASENEADGDNNAKS